MQIREDKDIENERVGDIMIKFHSCAEVCFVFVSRLFERKKWDEITKKLLPACCLTLQITKLADFFS